MLTINIIIGYRVFLGLPPPPQLVGLVTLLVQHIFLIQRSRRVAGRLHVIHVRLLVGELFEQ